MVLSLWSYVGLAIWWLAIISPSTGETQIFEYRTKETCQIIYRLYISTGTKATTCQWKDPEKVIG